MNSSSLSSLLPNSSQTHYPSSNLYTDYQKVDVMDFPNNNNNNNFISSSPLLPYTNIGITRNSLFKSNNDNTISLSKFKSRTNETSPSAFIHNLQHYDSQSGSSASIFEDLIEQRIRNAKANFSNAASQNFEYNSRDASHNLQLLPAVNAATTILRPQSNTNDNLITRRRNSGHFSPQLRSNLNFNKYNESNDMKETNVRYVTQNLNLQKQQETFSNETTKLPNYERKMIFSESEADSALPSSSCASTSSSGERRSNLCALNGAQLSPTNLSSNSSTSSGCYDNNNYQTPQAFPRKDFLESDLSEFIEQNILKLNKIKIMNTQSSQTVSEKRYCQIGHGIWAKKFPVEKENYIKDGSHLRCKSTQQLKSENVFDNCGRSKDISLTKTGRTQSVEPPFKRGMLAFLLSLFLQ